MAKTALEQWDETAANNTDVGSINIDEGCAPSGMNNAHREEMAQFAKWLGDDTLASAATTDLGSVPGRYVSVTGTTTITAFGTIKAGTIKYVKFTGALTLTHNATSLILPGLSNITTKAGDTAVFVSEGSGNWRCISYGRISPWSLAYDSGEQTITSGGFLTLTHGLGGRPSLVHATLRCKTAEHGYAVDEEIDAQVFENADRGVVLERKATTIVVLFGTAANVFTAKDTTTRAGLFLTNASWRLIVRAYL